MNFISNLVNGIPIVGHIKGVIHYSVGDKDGGNKAMYQSTRASAVMAGAVVGGVIGGPAGAVGGAVYAGCLSDTVASAAMEKPQGIVRHCENISNDFKHGRNPTISLISTGVHLGFDAVGGALGMGDIASVGKKIVGEEIIEESVKITAKEVAKLTAQKATETVVKKTIEKTAENAIIQAVSVTAHIAEHAVLETVLEEEEGKKTTEQKNGERKSTKKENNYKKSDKKKSSEKETDRKTSKSRISTETKSKSQPPEENKDNRKTDVFNNTNNFSDFLKLLKYFLETICREENQEKNYSVFQNISPGQKKSLLKIIKKLNYFGALEAVLKLVVLIFARYFPSEFTFSNFLSLMEFVKTYIANEIEKKSVIYLGTEATPSKIPFKQLVANMITVVTSDVDILRHTFRAFYTIRAEIEYENANKPVDPNFRDVFSAVHHYFKHRIVPGHETFSARLYYEWIRYFLFRVQRLPEWFDLGDRQNPRNEIVYELYIGSLGRRTRIVVKFQGDRIVLTSFYVVSTAFADDEEEDEFIDDIRRR